MYDELYEAWLKEKEEPELQKLPRDFYRRAADYVKKIKEGRRMLDEKTTKARLMKSEWEYAKRMIKELIALRYEKVLERIREDGDVPVEALTDEEKALYKDAIPLKDSLLSLIKDVSRGVIKGIKREEERYVLVRFLREVPAIIGSDMKTYGPFKPEDLATIPVENARTLIKQGVAIEVEVK